MLKCIKCNSEYKEGNKMCPQCGTPNPQYAGEDEKKGNKEDLDNHKTVKRSSQSYGALRLEDLEKGFIIDERYEIKLKLGQGGFGAVYLAHDKDMDIDKAIKVIPEAIVNDREAMYDLQREAQTMIALNHPNIVRVYDFHKSSRIKYIDMEYIDGKTLTEIKLEHKSKKVPEEIVVKYALQIAHGLAYAHANNVIHKDIKPQNVMINSSDEVKIMDFGIAETVRSSMSRIQNTSSSGTLVYMSPEQIMGKNVGKESDIYSFGALLYELLSGHPPFYKGDINYQIREVEPEPLESISKQLNNVIMRCLEKDYKNRYESFDGILTLLGGTVEDHEIVQRSSNTKEYESRIKMMVKVSLTTVPGDATVKIDRKIFTDRNFRYITGKHEIELSHEGYKTVYDTIEIKENSSNDFFIELVSLMGEVTVTSDPIKQPIIMNDEKTNYVTPHTFKDIIPSIQYTFQIDTKEFLSKEQIVRIKNKEKKEIALKSILGEISVLTEPPGKTITFNGKSTNFVTPYVFKYIVPQVTHTFQIEGYQYLSKPQEIKIKNNEKKEIVLKSILGKITVRSKPSNQPIIFNNKVTTYKTPHTFNDIIPGEPYTVKINSDECLTDEELVVIEEIEEKTIILESILCSLKVESKQPNQIIILNGEKTNHKTPYTFKLKQGKYKVSLVTDDDHYCNMIGVELKSQEQKEVTLVYMRYAYVTIDCHNRNIWLYIVGNKKDIVFGKKIRLKTGNYTLHMDNPDFTDYEFSLNEGEKKRIIYHEVIERKKLNCKVGNDTIKLKIENKKLKYSEEFELTGEKELMILPGETWISIYLIDKLIDIQHFENRGNTTLDLQQTIECYKRGKKRKKIKKYVFAAIILLMGIFLIIEIPKIIEVNDWGVAQIVNSIESYSKFINKHPNNEKVVIAREKIEYIKSGKIKELMMSANQLIEKNKFDEAESNLLAVLELDSTYVQAHESIDAINKKRKVIAENQELQKKIRNLLHSGSDSYNNGDLSQAETLYNEVLSHELNNNQAKKGLENIRIKRKQIAENKRVQQEIQYLLVDANRLYEQGNLVNSKTKCNDILTLDSNNSKASELLNKIWAEENELIFVEGSNFNMGSTLGNSDERPAHNVTVDDYYIGRYEVTQSQWKEVMVDNPSQFKSDNLPVKNVSWYEAVEFCNKKSIKEGLTPCYSGSGKNINCNFSANGYRLPTEAEWEFAARGGNQSKGYTFSGSNTIGNVAWYDSNSGDKTHPVGEKQPNELGIYDMSGNVFEWCYDWYNSEYYLKFILNNPRGPQSGSCHVRRGGSWFFNADVTDRAFSYPNSKANYIGFRLVRSIK